MATPKVEAATVRARDAILLPYKRKIASWIIRSDIWQASIASKNAAAKAEAIDKARNALAELDAQVYSLSDIIFPDAMRSKLLDEELAKMKKSYDTIRASLVTLGGKG